MTLPIILTTRSTVEINVMLNCVWLALWATNYINFADQTTSPLVWNFIL